MSSLPETVQANEADALDLDEVYELCAQFPLNSRCDDFSIPLTLDEQPGTLVGCGFELSVGLPGRSPYRPATPFCRVSLDDDTLTIAMEVGKRLDLLDNKRASEAIAIPLSHIFTADLRIWARGVDAVSFLASGYLYVLQDEDYDGFEREFNPTDDDDERGGFGDRDFAELEIGMVLPEPTAEGNRTNILRMTASEEFGAYLSDRLEPLLLDRATNPVLADITLVPDGEVDADMQAAQLEQLENDEQCIRCDLRGADLSGFDLDDANLEGILLTDANLEDVELEDAYLVGANLDRANFTDADVSGGRLTLASAVDSVWTGADLNVVNAQQANFTGARLTEVTLGGSNLEAATLTNADLTEADLSPFTAVGYIPFVGWDRYRLYTTARRAIAPGAIFSLADLDKARWDDADLTGATFVETDVDDTDLSGADLTGAIADEVDWTEAKLCDTTLPDGAIATADCPEDEIPDSE